MNQRQETFNKLSTDITTLQSENGKLKVENDSLIERIANATIEIQKGVEYLNQLMNSTGINSTNRELLNSIEESIKGISNYINGSMNRVVGGRKTRKYNKTRKLRNRKSSKKSRKSIKKKYKHQKGGFLYKKNSHRKSLRSSVKM